MVSANPPNRKKYENSTSDKHGTRIIQGGIKTPVYTENDEKKLNEISIKLAKNTNEQKEILKNLLSGYYQESSYELDSNDPFVSYEYHLKSLHLKYESSIHEIIYKNIRFNSR